MRHFCGAHHWTRFPKVPHFDLAVVQNTSFVVIIAYCWPIALPFSFVTHTTLRKA